MLGNGDTRPLLAKGAEVFPERSDYLWAGCALADDGRITTTRQGPNLILAAAGQHGQGVSVVKGQIEPVRRGWKRGGATVLPNPTAVVGKLARGPVTLAFLLYPVPPGKVPPRVKVEFAPVSGGRNPVALSVTVPGKRRMVIADQLGRGAMNVAGRVVRDEMALMTQ